MLAITVDVPFDENDGDILNGDVSLRDAIQEASPGETINFSPSLNNSTISLTLGEIAFEKNLTIDGTDANGVSRGITIKAFDPDANGDNDGDGSRIFNITNPSGATEVTLRGLTLRGGDVADEGGAIRSTAELHLDDCTIIDNHAVERGGGVFLDLPSNSSATIADSTITGNVTTLTRPFAYTYLGGGGLFAAISMNASLTVTDSTFDDNTAAMDGGGIKAHMPSRGHVEGTGAVLTVERTMLSGNHAGNRGGGLYAALGWGAQATVQAA